MDQATAAARCPRCGAIRPPDAPAGLCPACLLGAAADPSQTAPGDDMTRLAADATFAARGDAALGADDLTRVAYASSTAAPRVPPSPGQRFGPYVVSRLLGRGGMGEVYEVEQQDTGRRLALKVLRGRIDSAADRARFLREGQLAASVSHPHTVYIFGSEEIGGAPVIAMELLPGGTLKDRVVERGPMPVTDAVTAVLEIIGGLDAAQAAGILHRDIKPSNCFTDADGSVKVGDFGLSISTLARDVAAAGASQGFEGTPQFAAPEQLRGEPLDVRADIYAVGATLYYLLTGEAPFEARDLRELVTLVTTAPPPSPRTRAPQVPVGLAQVVQRCLAKDPADRPATYAALAEMLRPFATTAARPAPVGLRLLAGVIDALLIGAPLNMIFSSQTRSVPAGFQASINPVAVWAVLAGVIYFLVLEGRWAASLGKRLLGLRVVSIRGSLSRRQVAVRTVAYYAPNLPTIAATMLFGPATLLPWLNAHPAWAVLFSTSNFVLLALLFSTMRSGNGRAGIHDLLSGTRVVVRAGAVRLTKRSETDSAIGEPPPGRRAARIGPFDVGAAVAAEQGAALAEGFDPTLRRRVWIHVVLAGTPALDPVRRDVGRPGRLRWLTGRRSGAECWDAFEALDGRPLTAFAPGSISWSSAKGWLVDLAAEIDASAAEGSLPALALDRVWIRADDRAVLLDFPAPGVRGGPGPDAAVASDPLRFLAAVATRVGDGLSRDGARGAAAGLPLSATTVLREWTAGHLPSSLGEARAALARAAAAPDEVPRLRRAIPIALAALPVVLAFAASFAVAPLFRQIASLSLFEIAQLLGRVAAADAGRPGAPDPAQARDIEIYLAGRYARELVDPQIWNNRSMQAIAPLRATAARIAADHPAVSAEALAAARARLEPDLERIAARYRDDEPKLVRAGQVAAAVLVALGLALSMIASVISTLIAPGGVVSRLLGLAVVDATDREVGHARSILRTLIAWSPALAAAIWLGFSPVARLQQMTMSPESFVALPVAILGAGAVWTILRPARGLHDVIAGTRVVNR